MLIDNRRKLVATLLKFNFKSVASNENKLTQLHIALKIIHAN